MMKYYHHAQSPKPTIVNKDLCSVRKVKSGWLVFRVHTGELVGVVPTKLKAYYVAASINGQVDDYFFFGSGMFQGK